MLEPITDVNQPAGFIRYSRRVALSRLALVACFVVLLVIYTPSAMAALGALEFVLYLALFAATEIATRHPDPAHGFRRLRRQSEVLMVLLVANACWLAVLIRLYDEPIMQVEAALLAICVLLFAALRVHMSRISYLVGVAPPAITLLWIAVDTSEPLAANHYAFAMLLFVGAVLTVTWRQQTTDRALTHALEDLGRKNLALTQAMEEAKAASRAKTQLLAIASHEIRTPLNAVLGFGQALRRERLTTAQADLVAGVLDGGRQLTRLLDEILEKSRADVGHPGAPPPGPDQDAQVVAPVLADEPRLERRIRVLAAEDNAANRDVLAALLSAAPVDLTFAQDGAEALAAWRSQGFDLILMDVNMPTMSGLEALQEIRRAESPGARIPVWMLTANVFEDDVARYMGSGADGVLGKPVDVAALFSVLAQIADGERG